MEKTLAGQVINVCEEGYLSDHSQWTKEVGNHIATEEGITMCNRCWEVVDYLQGQQKQEVALSIRRIGKSGVVSIKEFYSLFPKGPLKISSKIAGIPKPVSCI